MLVLKRRDGERIVVTVGDVRIVLTVLKSSAGRAAIGLDAPRDVLVAREELGEPGKHVTRDRSPSLGHIGTAR